MATNIAPRQFFFARGFGIIEITPPECQVSAQPVEIEIGKRVVRAADVAQGTLQNRARAYMSAFGLVMKRDCQLNHTLDVLTEMPTGGPIAGHRVPDVLENFMRVEKVGAVKKTDTSV